MVTFHDGHDHDDGEGCELCPRCQFIERITGYVYAAAADGAEEWQGDVGPLIEHMHAALAGLHQLWAVTQGGDDGDATGKARDAAAALVGLVEMLAEVDERLQG
jgi:hypothetical protein